MPTPDRTSLAEIVAAAREILERDGLAAVTMQAVAKRVGVRAPSLYKRVDSRNALIELVAKTAVTELGHRIDAAAAPASTDPNTELRAIASDLRAFAHENPRVYQLIFVGSDATRPDPEVLASASASILRVAAELVGTEHALQAARTVTAWAHGFISMELAGAFKLGGDIDNAFEFGVALLADALSARAKERGYRGSESAAERSPKSSTDAPS
jgi:AcrR family transcriptional regulator